MKESSLYKTYFNSNGLSFQEGDIVLSSTNFPTEIHNEDFYYTHLMAGFAKTPTTTLLLAFDNPDLEPINFSDLFPNGKGHFYDQSTDTLEDNSVKLEIYGKYMKQLEKLQNIKI